MTANTYRAAGVDLNAASALKERIKSAAGITLGGRVIGRPGFFAGVYERSPDDDMLIAASADGVGTKLAVGQAARRYRGLGADLVNHCVNDLLTTGARPAFFLDYIGMSHAEREDVVEIAEGMAAACRDAGCVLLGGETAVMPGLYSDDDLDVVGFIAGFVSRSDLLGSEAAEPGDVLIGVPSNGPHTNGYSLIRRVFDIDAHPEVLDKTEWSPDLGRSLGDALLEPHRSYLDPLTPVLGLIRGMAHITGGGVFENLPRSLPKGLGADVDLSSWVIPPLFRLIQEQGGVDRDEMFRVFNMGLGMVLVASSDRADEVTALVPGAWAVGRVVEWDISAARVSLI
ncbi:MAG: phosphoribosylformylglycinamidine cyclo-ligase [Chloroflexi bacterium]|nr:phosphoribosylformylglycinamidine cyclo-ligase [Chloroflexota bacterium]